ncbi:MAG: class I SAM-dependent methyltransferase [Chloroflexota bacterium]|nr:class I SAM-dependent methyltransferase [Chloroflexota bacterium]
MTDSPPDDPIHVPSAGSTSPTGATSWFEPLYAAAARGETSVPWDRHAPHQLLTEWVQRRRLAGDGKRAVVVGCGHGDDAALVASVGYRTTAFDISASAIRAARERYPEARIEFVTADLFHLPEAWIKAFDLVVESQTIQALPPAMREEVIAHVVSLVAPGGTLIVQAVAANEGDVYEGPPWPLNRADIDRFAARLDPVEISHLPAPGQPAFQRWRAEFQRPSV